MSTALKLLSLEIREDSPNIKTESAVTTKPIRIAPKPELKRLMLPCLLDQPICPTKYHQVAAKTATTMMVDESSRATNGNEKGSETQTNGLPPVAAFFPEIAVIAQSRM